MHRLFSLPGPRRIRPIAPTELAVYGGFPPNKNASDTGTNSFLHEMVSAHFVYIDLINVHAKIHLLQLEIPGAYKKVGIP